MYKLSYLRMPGMRLTAPSHHMQPFRHLFSLAAALYAELLKYMDYVRFYCRKLHAEYVGYLLVAAV